MTDIWDRIALPGMPCYIIAEIGVNHDGNLDKAIRLIEAAVNAGADAVKFQTYRAEELTLPGQHRDMLQRLQMPLEWYPRLKRVADSMGIDFLSSPFDIQSARFLKELGAPALKIGSGELTNHAFLRQLNDLGLPIILSTGMATMEECFAAWNLLSGKLAVLHCVSAYPAAIAGYNLRAMHTIAQRFTGPVGLSDHTMGDHVAVAAVAMGARILEKHITLCFEDNGPDHAASMEPAEFADMVRKIRDVESAMGDGIKRPTTQELQTMKKARRVPTAEGFKRSP